MLAGPLEHGCATGRDVIGEIIPADANFTFHDAHEKKGRATRQHDIGVELFADVAVTLQFWRDVPWIRRAPLPVNIAGAILPRYGPFGATVLMLSLSVSMFI